MTKILLFRASDELSTRLMSELTSAGYEVSAPPSADVQTVLQQAPDLILLQTDVTTLDCCGLITQLKGNEASAPRSSARLRSKGPPWAKSTIFTGEREEEMVDSVGRDCFVGHRRLYCDSKCSGKQ